MITSPTNIRRYALEYAKAKRAHKFERLSKTFLNAVEVNARAFIQDRVERNPSKGVTLQ
jgi:hypothetical protein